MSDFSVRIIEWQRRHGRHSLPWQGADAYHVWLSEIMLQQTQVATVIPYYRRFIACFPNIATLAAAAEEEVLAHWSGLGYYARGRNLHRAAQIITKEYRGEFPREFEQILQLPGIGRSTAAAICALAFHERRAILDGNVKRVLARYCTVEGYPGKKEVEAQLWQQAEALLPYLSSSLWERGDSKDSIAAYTQGLMDLGATVCTRSKPNCSACPVQADCKAYQRGCIEQFPASRPKKALPEKQATFLLLMHGNDILLEKRPGSGVWGGLWCLPQFENEAAALSWCAQRCIETDKNTHRSRAGKKINPHDAAENGSKAELTSQCKMLPPLLHTFTHFKLHITPLLVRVAHKSVQAQEAGRVWLNMEDALHAAIPTPVSKLLRASLSGMA